VIVREAISRGAAVLKAAGIENASLDASLLLAHALNIDRTKLIAKGTDLLPEETQYLFRTFLDRRLNGDCIAYITGKKEFYGLEFPVNPSVLVPRPETEILVEAALEIIKEAGNNFRILDLCTGSGAVAIALKYEMPILEVSAVEISVEALETAKTNARLLLSAGNTVNFFLGDLYKALPLPHSTFSLIVSNSPYIPTDEIQTLCAEVQNEPRLALDGGKSGLEIIKRIIEDAPQFLEKNGSLALEADPRQMEKIKLLLENKGFRDIKLYKDLSGQERVITGVYE
jgi:release factor glutamine methyltransferase